jgi:epidermal growth factor receptor substrate 15
MLTICRPQEPSKVTGQEAVTFFKKSNLPVEKLKSIWTIAARTSNDYLTREEFYIALRLIAYAQNGVEPTEQSLRLDLKAPMPDFSDFKQP